MTISPPSSLHCVLDFGEAWARINNFDNYLDGTPKISGSKRAYLLGTKIQRFYNFVKVLRQVLCRIAYLCCARTFVEKWIEAERIRRLLELMTLRTFFYLRQIAHERGTDVQQLEVDFAEAGPDMLEALYNGVAHVGK